MAEKVRVTIVTPFNLNLKDGGTVPFAVGTHEVEPEIADHWFVKAHSDDPPPVVLKAGTRAFADAQIADRAAVQRVEDARRAAIVNKIADIHTENPLPVEQVSVKVDKLETRKVPRIEGDVVAVAPTVITPKE